MQGYLTWLSLSLATPRITKLRSASSNLVRVRCVHDRQQVFKMALDNGVLSTTTDAVEILRVFVDRLANEAENFGGH